MSDFVLDGKDLQKIKNMEIEMLKECISVCKKLGLKYYLIEGTLLGAVRHKGFIPWDDDIDIGLMRKDYEIFKKEAPAYLSEHLFLQDNTTDPGALMNYIKIRNSETTFIETSVKNRKMNHGVYIDVFPIDYYPDGKFSEMLFIVKRHCLKLRVEKGFYHERKKRPLKNRIINGTISFLLGWITPEAAVKIRENLYKSVRKGKKLANFSTPWGIREVVPADWYGEGVLMEFEGIEVRCPKEYHKWLTKVYEDYTILPPESERKSHHYAEVIDLDKPYTHYIKP